MSPQRLPALLAILLLAGALAPAATARAPSPDYEEIDALLLEVETTYFGRIPAGKRPLLQAMMRAAAFCEGEALELHERHMIFFEDLSVNGARINNAAFWFSGDLSALDLDPEFDRRLIQLATRAISAEAGFNGRRADGSLGTIDGREMHQLATARVVDAVVRDLRAFAEADVVSLIDGIVEGTGEAVSRKEAAWLHDRLMRRFWYLENKVSEDHPPTETWADDAAISRVKAAYERLGAWLEADEAPTDGGAPSAASEGGVLGS